MDYRVGAVFRPIAKPQVDWVEANYPNLQPAQWLHTGDDTLRLVLTIRARNSDMALGQAEEVFDLAERTVPVDDRGWFRESGPQGISVWNAEAAAPAPYEPPG